MSEDIQGTYSVDAKSIEYDNKHNKVVAQGNAKVFRDRYLLTADKITYDKTTGKAYVQGNPYLIAPSGDQIYGKSLEIDTRNKNLTGDTISARIGASSKFTADAVEYKHPDTAMFKNVLYSSCQTCETHAPQWQIRSGKITFNRKHDTTFMNNLFEVYGVPIFYLPYLRVASPDAKPKSGFLVPRKIYYRSIYGTGIGTPYYFRIADNKDLLYTPIITTRQGVLHNLDYKHLLSNGEYNLHAEYIRQHKTTETVREINQNNTKSKVTDYFKTRYYISGNAKYRLSNKCNFTAQIERVSDRNYLNQYWFQDKNYLASTAQLEYIDKRNYSYIRSYGFQNLREDNNTTSTILPIVYYHRDFMLSNQNRLAFDVQAMNILRKQGNDLLDASVYMKWYKSYLIGNNEVDIYRNLRFDFFNFSNKTQVQHPLGSNNYLNVYRVHPEIAINWRYPVVKSTPKYDLYIEPTINAIISPNASSNRKVSVIDDSQALELSDTNLFTTNRYSGIGFIESGTRINYGLRGFILSRQDVEYLFGQSFVLKKNLDYAINSGLYNKHFSDYIGRISVKPYNFLDIYYRARIDSQNYEFRRSEIGTLFKGDLNHKYMSAFTVDIRLGSYRFLPDKSISNELQDIRKLLSIEGKLYITKAWSVNGEFKRGFANSGSFSVLSKFGVGYSGECANFNVALVRRYSRATPGKKGTAFEFEIRLKDIN
jgi:LPS-assembly protein